MVTCEDLKDANSSWSILSLLWLIFIEPYVFQVKWELHEKRNSFSSFRDLEVAKNVQLFSTEEIFWFHWKAISIAVSGRKFTWEELQGKFEGSLPFFSMNYVSISVIVLKFHSLLSGKVRVKDGFIEKTGLNGSDTSQHSRISVGWIGSSCWTVCSNSSLVGCYCTSYAF